jgi:hypothetical protein
MNTDSGDRTPALPRFALGPSAVDEFSPWKRAESITSDLRPSVVALNCYG